VLQAASVEADLTLAREKERVARERLRSLRSVLVAYSGGVDSSYLLWLARDVLGDGAVAFTALSAAVPADELEGARELARALGAKHVERSSAEIDDPRYVRNEGDRCYFCKTELYTLATRYAEANAIAAVVSGTNADDLLDYRPGLTAASEHQIVHPLAEAKLSKAEIRALSRAAGLPTWDKPQQPCLASRIPYGTEVTRERLEQLARAEMALRALGLREFRVRFHGEIARIEIADAELSRLIAVRAEAARALRQAGFRFASVDLEPFRSGRLNEAAGLVPLRSS
jgi:pyridinium-3,5-biscarboxylic acid mononucleotide sulfurtransferase